MRLRLRLSPSLPVWLLMAAAPAAMSAQSFTLVTTGSPFSGLDIGNFSTPAFVDIDNDGDLDLFSGRGFGTTGGGNGTIRFYRNDGSPSSASFTLVTGSSNPFNGVDVGGDSQLAFVDIDNDGDLDAFIGESDGFINFYRNTGTVSSPTFSSITGSSNPFNGVDIGSASAIAFVDIDGDGDQDAFIGESTGIINYYRNGGTASAPSFAEITGPTNPFNGVDVGAFSIPSFADLDGDGDFDCLVGEEDGVFTYFLNTGSASSPVFTQQNGGSDPFNGFNVTGYSAPIFADIDNDGDPDLITGRSNGQFTFYRYTSLLPVELLWLQAELRTGAVHLSWATATELNNEGFTVQRSVDGRLWESLTFVEGGGTRSELREYAYADYLPMPGVSYYRLEQRDFDGATQLSPAVEVYSAVKGPVLDLYPNPASSQLSIRLAGTETGTAQIQFLDASGHLCREQTAELAEGRALVLPVPLEGLAPGAYYVLVTVRESRFAGRVVVQ
ncbi:MAG: FG-GAP-like repeat-containing protein [Bacteroidia bacterium]|nr:FG-GAP-like repeat-containing protein [Bacteroidia bacterium]